MTDAEECRFQSHKLLLELDAATTMLMMLVSARQSEGSEWLLAVRRHKLAYEAWVEFLSAPATDPMSLVDRRTAGGLGTLADSQC